MTYAFWHQMEGSFFSLFPQLAGDMEQTADADEAYDHFPKIQDATKHPPTIKHDKSMEV